MPLLWRIFLGNAVVLGVASTVLVLSPATVSFPAAARELVVLAVGLAVMLAVNYALLRRAVSPVQRLARVMQTVDPLAPGRRAGLPGGAREVTELGPRSTRCSIAWNVSGANRRAARCRRRSRSGGGSRMSCMTRSDRR